MSSQEQQYQFLGMGDGTVRCVRVKEDAGDLTDFWSLGTLSMATPSDCSAVSPLD